MTNGISDFSFSFNFQKRLTTLTLVWSVYAFDFIEKLVLENFLDVKFFSTWWRSEIFSYFLLIVIGVIVKIPLLVIYFHMFRENLLHERFFYSCKAMAGAIICLLLVFHFFDKNFGYDLMTQESAFCSSVNGISNEYRT